MPASYPVGEDLANWLVDGGVVESLPIDYSPYELAMAAAVQAWEANTGYTPFIAEASASTTTYQARGCLLDLRGGYVQIARVTVEDELLEVGRQYMANPVGAVASTYLDFAVAPQGLVTVVGRRGRSADCPSDVWLALLSKAAVLASPMLGKASGNVAELRQGEVSVKFNVNASQHSIWEAAYAATLRTYRRPRVF